MASSIEKQVMAGVGVVYAARKAASLTALKLYVLAAGLIALWQLTWVHKVFANWQAVGLRGTWQFLTYAVVHTHASVQLTLAAIAVTGCWLAVDAVRGLSQRGALVH
ncbi:MAG: hypothetical protein KGI70_01040 [Patescibacteria group bacterium]|nr:hypothetical protein [Patescibacteria group bacterium]